MRAATSGGLMLCRPSISLRPGQGSLLMSDLHLGSPQTDEGLIQKELHGAKQRGDRININGDLFDAIVTADAKRYRPSSVHPRLHGNDDLLGAALQWGEELLSPYADLIDMIGSGNHDDTVVKHHSFCPVSALIHRLQTYTSHPIHYGGYAGFLRYNLERTPHQKKYHRASDSLTIFYWHGAGGGSSLSSALGEFASKASFVEQADVYWFAHKHIRLVCPVERIACSLKADSPRTRTAWLVRSAAYMHSYRGQSQDSWRTSGRQGNYAADRLLTPAGRGGLRLVVGEHGLRDTRVDFVLS